MPNPSFFLCGWEGLASRRVRKNEWVRGSKETRMSWKTRKNYKLDEIDRS